MLAAGVVSDLPFGVHNWPLSNLYDTVASTEPNFLRRLKQSHVCPLIAMIVDIVDNLRQKDALRFQDPPCFAQKGGKRVRKIILVFLRRPSPESKAGIEVLGLVPALVGYVGRIIHNHIEA